MKNAAIIIFSLILIALVFYAYKKYTPKTEEEIEAERELRNLLNSEIDRTVITNICPDNKDMWFATKNNEFVRGRTIVINKNDGQGFKNYGLAVGAPKLWLNNITDTENYILGKGSPTRKPSYIGKINNGWIVKIDRELTTTVCVNKGQKVF